MIVRNFLSMPFQKNTYHGGNGQGHGARIFSEEDFDTPVKFFNYTEIPSGVSIGVHPHTNDEEIYVVLSGTAVMTVNDEQRQVGPGDVIVNKPGWSHGLENPFSETVKLLVIGIDPA